MRQEPTDTIVDEVKPQKGTKTVYFVGNTFYKGNTYYKCEAYEATDDEMGILDSLVADCVECAEVGITRQQECEKCKTK